MTTVFNQDVMFNTATYWAPGTRDGKGGFSAFPTPITLSCRWEDKKERFIDAQGNEKRSSAVVYPEQSVEIGGWFYKGTSTTADPRNVSNAFQIKMADEIEDLSGQYVEYKAWL